MDMEMPQDDTPGIGIDHDMPIPLTDTQRSKGKVITRKYPLSGEHELPHQISSKVHPKKNDHGQGYPGYHRSESREASISGLSSDDEMPPASPQSDGNVTILDSTDGNASPRSDATILDSKEIEK